MSSVEAQLSDYQCYEASLDLADRMNPFVFSNPRALSTQ